MDVALSCEDGERVEGGQEVSGISKFRKARQECSSPCWQWWVVNTELVLQATIIRDREEED